MPAHRPRPTPGHPLRHLLLHLGVAVVAAGTLLLPVAAGEHTAAHGQVERTDDPVAGTVTEVADTVSVDPSVADAPAAVAVDEGPSVPSARAGSERTYPPRVRVSIRGSVLTKPRSGPRRPRPVQLAEQRDGRWAVVAAKPSSRQGAVTFTVSSGATEGVRTFRVQAPRFRALRAVTSPPTTIRVRATPSAPVSPPTDAPVDDAVPTSGFDAPEPLPEGYRAVGSDAAWEYLVDGGGRWNPCRVIRWTYDPSAEGYEGLADVKRAFAMISGVSGLRFTYVGPSSWRYTGSMTGFPSRRADIAVGWAGDQEYDKLAGDVVGVGGGQIRPTTDPDVKYEVVRGFLTLDNGHPGLAGGFGVLGWGRVMLHEILHAVGLGHPEESVQLMYASAGLFNHRFAAGDITGMEAIGATQGCL